MAGIQLLRHANMSINRSSTTNDTGDIAAQKFITAAQITSPTQINAITELVKNIKSRSLWGKFRFIYPFVGGTEFSHSFNLVNPVDSDSAFRLVFYGGRTHDANGVSWGGTGYANTSCSTSANLDLNKGTSIGLMRRLAGSVDGDVIDCGSYSNNGQSTLIAIQNSGNTYIARAHGNGIYGTTDNQGKGLFTITSEPNNTGNASLFQNDIYKGGGYSGGSLSEFPVYLGALNLSNMSYGYSQNACSFAFMGDYLTHAQIIDMHYIIGIFESALNRTI